MTAMLVAFHILVCLSLTLVVLLQHGTTRGLGVAFAGSSATVFGGRGASTFMARFTAGTAATFILTSLLLSYVSTLSPLGM